MNYIFALVLCTVSVVTFGQHMRCADWPEYDWVIAYHSAGEPFTTADTVILIPDPEMIDEEVSDSVTMFNQNDTNWNVVFASDSTLNIYKINGQKVALSSTTIENNDQRIVSTPNGSFVNEAYSFDLKWTCDGKSLKIGYRNTTITYKVGKRRNNRLVCIKVP